MANDTDEPFVDLDMPSEDDRDPAAAARRELERLTKLGVDVRAQLDPLGKAAQYAQSIPPPYRADLGTYALSREHTQDLVGRATQSLTDQTAERRNREERSLAALNDIVTSLGILGDNQKLLVETAVEEGNRSKLIVKLTCGILLFAIVAILVTVALAIF